MYKTRIRCTLITPEHVVYDCWIRRFIRRYYFTIIVDKELESKQIIPTEKIFSKLGEKMCNAYVEMLQACENGAKFIFKSSKN